MKREYSHFYVLTNFEKNHYLNCVKGAPLKNKELHNSVK